jgi:hypothetical protein
MIDIENFSDFSKIKLGEANGGYTPVYYDGKRPKIRIGGTHALRAPFGLADSYSGGVTKTLALVPHDSLDGFCAKLDDVIPSMGPSNAAYKPLRHFMKDGTCMVHVKVRPSTKIHIASSDGYKDSHDVPKGSRVLIVFRMGSLWCTNDAYGLILEADRILAYPPVTVEDVFPIRPY